MQFIDLKAQYARIEQEIQARIQAVFEHGQFVMGPEVAELEARLADFVGVRHCVGVSSGTDALLAAMLALEIGRGDEVITSPFSFAASAEMITLLGARPVFVDIDPVTYNIDPARLEEAITGRTRAIMPVSLYGLCADLDRINEIAARHHLPVIEDAAQSFGARYHDRHSCALSTIGCTSFFPAKPLGAYGDAGACFTNDDGLADALRQIRNHGQSERYYHARLGLNARLDTLQAAILLAKLGIFADEVEARALIGARYTTLLQQRGAVSTEIGGDGLLTPTIPQGYLSVYAQYAVQVPEPEVVIQRLADQDIPTAVHYPRSLGEQPVFNFGVGQTDSASVRAAQRVVCLPMHPYLEPATQERIVEELAAAAGL